MLDLIIAAALLQATDMCHAAALPPGRAACPAWRAMHRDDRGQWFADPASLVRGGALFDIRIRFVYAEAGAGEIHSIVAAYRFDCAARTVAIGGGHAYDEAGAQLDEEEPAEAHTAPAPVGPGTPEAAMLAAWCLG
jgi:hypothetical protein